LTCNESCQQPPPSVSSESKGQLFLTYYEKFGRFNNQRRYLYTALAMGKALNRTVVIPWFDAIDQWAKNTTIVGVSANYYFNMSLMNQGYSATCAGTFQEHEVYDALDFIEVDPASDQFHPEWFTAERLRAKYGRVTQKLLRFYFVVDAWDFGELKASGTSERLAMSDASLFGIRRSSLEGRVWLRPVFNVPSWETLETDEYLDVRAHVRFTDVFQDIAAAFIAESLEGRYIAVHFRHEDWEPQQMDCPVCCLSPTLDYHVSVIRDVMDKVGAEVVFVMAERSRLYEIRKVLDEAGIDTIVYARLFRDGNENTIVEQIIASHAQAFVGSLCSTLSGAVWEERKLLGHPANLSLWW